MSSLLSILLLSEKLTLSLEKGVLGTLLYSAIGIVMCVVAYYVIDLIIPGKMGKQIAEDKNIAIAIVAGSMIIGVCLIIAAAIVG